EKRGNVQLVIDIVGFRQVDVQAALQRGLIRAARDGRGRTLDGGRSHIGGVIVRAVLTQQRAGETLEQRRRALFRRLRHGGRRNRRLQHEAGTGRRVGRGYRGGFVLAAGRQAERAKRAAGEFTDTLAGFGRLRRDEGFAIDRAAQRRGGSRHGGDHFHF